VATKHLLHPRFSVRTATIVTVALVLTGCGNDDELAIEEPSAPQEVVTIGGALSSPGLISGTNPTEVTGTEVDLVTALTQRMATLPEEAEPFWIPTRPNTVAERLVEDEFDMSIGQFTDADFGDEAARIGPYATVEAGLLVHREANAEPDEPVDAFAPSPLESLDDVAQASVCVVAGSIPEVAGVPVEDATVEPTVTECEIGMRSGRYDAIAADDLQLAGVMMDPEFTDRYDLMLWADLVADQGEENSEIEVNEALLETSQYWIGASSTYCADAGEAFEELVEDGALEELFEPWEQVEGYQYEPVEADEVSVKHCKTAS